jgi:adenylosuccinate synthase
LSQDADIVARYQGGPNAGHTVWVGDRQFILHLIPSGILRPRTVCYIGNGVVVDPEALRRERETVLKQGISVDGRLFVSGSAHVILPDHRVVEKVTETGATPIGTTGRGIGPAVHGEGRTHRAPRRRPARSQDPRGARSSPSRAHAP